MSGNDNIISAYARSENGCGKCQFWGVKLGQDLENRAAHPYHEFPGIDIKLALLSPGLLHRRKGFQEWVRWGGLKKVLRSSLLACCLFVEAL